MLEALLRLLHPLTPFVTEELWRSVAPRLGIDAATISLQAYPQAGDFGGNDFTSAEADIEWLKAMVSALRRIRSELGVSPAKQVTLLLQGGNADDAARAGRFASQLKFLNRIERIDTIAGDPPPAAAAIVGELKLFVPLEGLVDLDAERVRLDKELKRVDGELAKSQGKLASDTFVQNAPAAVVEQERQRLADWTHATRCPRPAAAREALELDGVAERSAQIRDGGRHRDRAVAEAEAPRSTAATITRQRTTRSPSPTHPRAHPSPGNSADAGRSR